MTNPINSAVPRISYDHNDKPVYPKPVIAEEKKSGILSYDQNDKPVYPKFLTSQQKKTLEIFESSLCSSSESIPRPLRSSATDLIALPKGASSDEDIEGEPPVSER